MKFTIQKEAFAKALGKISKIINRQSAAPILTSIKMDAGKDGLTLTGGNDDMFVKTSMTSGDKDNGLSIVDGGSIAVSAGLFNSIINHLAKGVITIETTDNYQVQITTQSSAFKLDGLDASNYPHIPKVNADQSAQIPSSILQEIIQQTIFATSSQESRPILTGVHLIINKSTLIAVATDGHRLSVRSIKLPKAIGNYDAIVPAGSLKELLQLIGDSSTVEVRLAKSEALFIAGNTSLYTRLIEGNYPNVAQLIKNSFKTAVKFNADDLLGTIERASIISHAKQSGGNFVKLSVQPATNTIEVKANSADVGKVDEKVPMDSVSGQNLDISCNPDYLIDALKSLDGLSVKIGFTTSLSPLTITPGQKEAGKFIQLITPVTPVKND